MGKSFTIITSILAITFMTGTGCTKIINTQQNETAPIIPVKQEVTSPPKTSKPSASPIAKKPTDNKSPVWEGKYYEDLLTRIFFDSTPYTTVDELNGEEIKNLPIKYGDVTNDGIEEAIVGIPSGGTAGDIAVLIYSIVDKDVQLIDTIKGYKISGKIQGKKLLITTPYYLQTDANCCPSFFDNTVYSWNGKKFENENTTRIPAKDMDWSKD